jgi:hypothetical protein
VIERAVPLPATGDVDAKLKEFSARTGLRMDELLARSNPPDPVQLLESAGWTCSQYTLGELSARYGRAIALTASDEPTSDNSNEGSRGGFVTAWLPVPS